MTEDDFWRGSKLIQGLHLSEAEKEQRLGRLSRVLRIPHKTLSRNHLQVDMLPEYKEFIFRQLPQVREQFDILVPHQKSEKEFWRHFFIEQREEGQLYSDALEIKQPYNPPQLLSLLTEELPQQNGLYKCNTQPRKKASDLIKTYNHHSGQVLDKYHKDPPQVTLIKTEFKQLPRGKPFTESGAPAPSDVGMSLIELVRGTEAKSAFPSHAESAETMRSVMRQTFQRKTEAELIEDRAKKATASFYEVLRFFYSLFPLKGPRGVGQAFKAFEVIREQFEQTRKTVAHRPTLEALNDAVEMCRSRLSQLRTKTFL